MNRQKELAKNTIILTIGKICTQFVSFLLLPLYTSLLIPEEYGIVDLVNTYIALLTPIVNWQFENGLFRFLIDYRNDASKQKRLVSTVLLTNIVQSILYGVLFILFYRFISIEYKIFLALDVVANIFLNTLLQFPRGVGKNLIYSIGSFLSASTTVAFNVVFIVGMRWGAYGMFLATLLAKIVTCVYLFCAMKTWRFFSIRAYDKTLLIGVLRYSVPLVPNQLSWWIVGASDRTIISHFMGVFSNGIYSVANKFSIIYVTFYNIFNLSWTESVSLHMNDSDRDEFLTGIINTMFNIFAGIDIGIIACMPFVFELMVDSKYHEAYYQIPILMIAVLFQVIVGLYSVIYVALKKSKEIAKTSFFAAIINILVNIIFIKEIGLYAASISTLVAYATMAIYRYFDVRKYVSVRLNVKNVIAAVISIIIAVFAYYTRNMFYCLGVLLYVITYFIIVNRHFLYSIFVEIKFKIRMR